MDRALRAANTKERWPDLECNQCMKPRDPQDMFIGEGDPLDMFIGGACCVYVCKDNEGDERGMTAVLL